MHHPTASAPTGKSRPPQRMPMRPSFPRYDGVGYRGMPHQSLPPPIGGSTGGMWPPHASQYGMYTAVNMHGNGVVGHAPSIPPGMGGNGMMWVRGGGSSAWSTYPPGGPSYGMPMGRSSDMQPMQWRNFPNAGGLGNEMSLQENMDAEEFDINERGRERLHNDYNQHFIDTGERPQNFVRDADESRRFEEYPKLEKLMQQKREVVQCRATPAQQIQANLRTFDLTTLSVKFDVILVDPPWPEYHDRVAGGFSPTEDLTPWTLEDMMKLRVDLIAETPSFCFLWCGVTHLEDGRQLLSKWGFRRCEDVCWLKTNKKVSKSRQLEKGFKSASVIHNENSYLQRTKEHCLMGIRGTVRRSQDTHFIHANLDTDVILDEEFDEIGSTAKPYELYDVIERFCLGRRRLELFGTDRNLRNGWLTIGNAISFTHYDAQKYASWFEGDSAWPEIQDYNGGRYTGSTPEIEMLRPKSPVRSAKQEETE